MTLYSTLDEVKTFLRTDSSAAADNAKIMRLLRIASRRMDTEFRAVKPLFAPVKEERTFAVTSERVNSGLKLFLLDGPLLELSTVSAGETALTVATQVAAYPNANSPPFTHLRLTSSAPYASWYSYVADDGTPLFVTINGVWGLRRDYSGAWMKVDDLAADITASATTLTVADIDGADAYGVTPRISAGSLLRIGTEYLEATATNTTTNVATARRGVNGTTAAAHSTGDDVYVFQVEDVVRYAVARQTGLMYARMGAYTTVEISGMGSEVRYPADLLTEVRAVIQEFSYGY